MSQPPFHRQTWEVKVMDQPLLRVKGSRNCFSQQMDDLSLDRRGASGATDRRRQSPHFSSVRGGVGRNNRTDARSTDFPPQLKVVPLSGRRAAKR